MAHHIVPPDVATRCAAPDDVEAVADLEASCLGADAWSLGLVREGILGALPTVTYLVAVVEGSVVGHAVVSVVGDLAELQRIAVHTSWRRHGIAGDLLAAVREAARSADRLLLEVREDNHAAAAFYAAHGFAELARRPRYYADGTTAVVLQLPL